MGISDMQKADMKSQSKQRVHNDCDQRMDSLQRMGCRQRSGAATQKRYYDSKMNRAFATMAVLLCLSNIVSGSRGGCPARCSCMVKNVAFCNNKGFTTTPSDFTSVIEELYLFNNNITTIPKQSMRPLTKLRLLDISGNRISNYALWDGVFSGFPLLENLMLQDNQITKITADMFKGLKNLARIYLQDNRIASISDGAFNNLPSLVELKLKNNRLTSFPKLEMTPNLLLLDLSHNKLRTIRDMALSTVNVEQLLLQDNQLTQLRTSIFDETSHLSQLDISNNRLTAVPQVIKSLGNLRMLNMSVNKIETIPKDTFTELTKLKVLDLHDMQLTTLSDELLPPGVILNVFDIAGNKWDCECGLSWLPQYTSIFEDAFPDANQIVCAGPPRVKGRRIKDMTFENFDCKEKEKPLEPPIEELETLPMTTLSTTTSRRYIIDPCDVYICFNGGKCTVKKYHPRCNCTKDWTGQQCQISLTTPTSTTTTTTRSTTTTTRASKDKPAGKQLFINSESITETSVEIILPQTDTEFLVSVSEVGRNDRPTELKIKPRIHPFTVKGLHSGRVYNICIHSPLVSRDRPLPAFISNRDSLCGTVKTDGNPEEGISIDNTLGGDGDDNAGSKDPEKTPERPTVSGGHAKDGDVRPGGGGKLKVGVSDPVTTTSESGDFQILYPALGAGLGAVVIVVMLVMFFFCYRQKKRLKMKNQNSDYIPGSPTDTTQSADMELATVVHHHHHNHYSAIGSDPSSATAPGKKAGTTRKPANQKSSSLSNNGKPRHVSTPNQNSSLGRCSSSSNSNCGTLQTRYAETPQHYHQPQQQYVSTGPAPHPPYEIMQQNPMNARGSEYVYKNHQNNNNSTMPITNGHYLPHGRPYEPEMDEMQQPLVGSMNHYNYSPVEGQMYVDNYGGLGGPQYHPQPGALTYPHVNSRSAFQPIQSPRKNSVRTPTSESGPITTHVNTAHVLPTSTCMTRNLMNESIPIYPEGVPVA